MRRTVLRTLLDERANAGRARIPALLLRRVNVAFAPAVAVDADELIGAGDDFVIGTLHRVQVRAAQAQRQQQKRSDPRLQAGKGAATAHESLFIPQEARVHGMEGTGAD